MCAKACKGVSGFFRIAGSSDPEETYLPRTPSLWHKMAATRLGALGAAEGR
jgi:hypothetical protein